MKKVLFWLVALYVVGVEGIRFLFEIRTAWSHGVAEMVMVGGGLVVVGLYAYERDNVAGWLWRRIGWFIGGWFLIDLVYFREFIWMDVGNEWEFFQLLGRGITVDHLLLLAGAIVYPWMGNVDMHPRKRGNADEFLYLGERLSRHDDANKQKSVP